MKFTHNSTDGNWEVVVRKDSLLGRLAERFGFSLGLYVMHARVGQDCHTFVAIGRIAAWRKA